MTIRVECQLVLVPDDGEGLPSPLSAQL